MCLLIFVCWLFLSLLYGFAVKSEEEKVSKNLFMNQNQNILSYIHLICIVFKTIYCLMEGTIAILGLRSFVSQWVVRAFLRENVHPFIEREKWRVAGCYTQ